MSALLDRIVTQTRIDLEARRQTSPLPPVEPASHPGVFSAALAGPELSLIAELKPRSPSKGLLRERVQDAFAGYRARAQAVSVLVDEPFFGGGYQLFARARAALPLPLLAKGFFIDPWQVEEARAYGADAVLLIVRILDDATLRTLIDYAHGWGMDALVEVHSDDELSRAVAAGAKVIGVNARDLDTLAIDLDGARARLGRVPPGVIRVAESGLETREDVDSVRGLAQATLIGTAFMKAPDVAAAMDELGWSQ